MGGGSTTTGYKYYANVLIGICEGPAYILNVWNGKAKQSFEASGMDIMYGSQGQDPWPQITSAHPTEALGYSGLCYVAKQAMELDGSASLPSLSFEVVGGGRVIDDADASFILVDFLTNPLYGAGWPTQFLDDMFKYSAWCRAANLLVSPALTEQLQASEFLQQLALATNSQYVWSQNKLRVVPFCDQITVGNDYTYYPDLTPKYDLDDDDFIVAGGDDPVTCTRNSSADAFNHVQVEFVNRANDYNVEVADAKDLADIEAKGLRSQDPLQLHMICDPAIARNLAQYRLQQVLYRRAQYTFKLGWKYCLLEPLDLITITDSAMGLNKAPVQIMEIAEDEEGVFTITALEFPFGVSSTSSYDSQGNNGYTPDYKIDPGDSNAPVIFEPPYALAGRTEVWLGTSGGSDWGGCEVHVSTDGTSYTKIGSINSKARHGVLTAQLPFGYDPDTTHTLSVDLTTSGGTLQSATQNDADLLTTLAYVGGELIAYANATLTNVGKYDLTYLRRGAYGTTVDAHAMNSKFMRLDGAVFRYALPTNMVGKTIYIKLPAFNVYGTQLQDIADVIPYSHSVTGADAVPLQVGGISATAGLASVMLTWTANTADTGLDHYEILRASSDDRNQFTVVGTTTGASYADMVGVTGATYYYWVRGVSKADLKGPTAIHGIPATTGVIGTIDLGPLVVTAANIANGAIDLSGGKVTGQVQTDYIADAAITSAKIGTAAVGTAAIQNAAITNALIGDAVIDNAKIANVSANKITAGTITASVSITAPTILGGSIQGTTGTFAGSLAAGVLDLATAVGQHLSYPNAGTYDVITMPYNGTIRFTIVGAGGGGAGGSRYNVAGNGGYAGAVVAMTLTAIPQGTIVSVSVGAAGSAGLNGGNGGNGGATVLSVGGTNYTANGGAGGVAATASSSLLNAMQVLYHTNDYGDYAATYTSAGNAASYAGSIGGARGGSVFGTNWVHRCAASDPTLINGGAGTLGGGGGGGAPTNVWVGSRGFYIDPVDGGGGDGMPPSSGGAGGAGFAFIEIFNPNGVVLYTKYDALIQWLNGTAIGPVPSNVW